MATIVLQLSTPATKSAQQSAPPQRGMGSTTATVSRSPGRYHYATVAGRARTFEKVGVDSSGNEVYRDQTRR